PRPARRVRRTAHPHRPRPARSCTPDTVVQRADYAPSISPPCCAIRTGRQRIGAGSLYTRPDVRQTRLEAETGHIRHVDAETLMPGLDVAAATRPCTPPRRWRC